MHSLSLEFYAIAKSVFCYLNCNDSPSIHHNPTAAAAYQILPLLRVRASVNELCALIKLPLGPAFCRRTHSTPTSISGRISRDDSTQQPQSQQKMHKWRVKRDKNVSINCS
jgi:hypothetical protein